MPSLASTLEMMLSRANITTVDEFADMLLSAPTFIANLIRSEAAATAAEAAATAVGMMTDATTTRSVGTEAALTADDMVDTAIAEAMVAEALCMADEAQVRRSVSGLPRSVLVGGSPAQSSELHCSIRQRHAPIPRRQRCWPHRECSQSSRRRDRWRSKCWRRRRLVLTLQVTARCTKNRSRAPFFLGFSRVVPCPHCTPRGACFCPTPKA